MKEKFVQDIIDAYKEINFVEKAERIFRFKDFDNRLTTFKQEDVLSFLQNIGYDFVAKKPGKEFTHKETNDSVEFVVSFNLNGGVVLPYLYVYVNGEKVPYDYPGFVFTYKYLIDDFESLMNPSTVYTSYSDLEEIVKEVLNLYEEFKKAFLHKVKIT